MLAGSAVRIAEEAHDRPHVADAAAAHQIERLQPLRVRAHHESLANLDAGAIARLTQLLHLVNVKPDGLFAQHVLARLSSLMDHGTCR